MTGLPNARAMIRGEFASLREMARVSPTFVPAAYAWGSFRTPPAGGPLQTAPSSSLSHSSSDTATATTTPQPAQPRPPFAIVPGPLTYFILLEFRPVARQPPADAAVFARSLAKFHKRSIEVHRSRAARPEPSCAGGGGAKGKARGGRREVGRGPRLLEMEHQQQRRRPDELRRSDDDDDEMTDGDDEDEDDDALRDHDYGRRQRRRQGGRGHGRGQGLFGFDTATCHGRTSQRVGRWTASWAELFGGLLGAMFERDEVDRRARRRAAAAAITGEGEGKERVVVVPRAVREADAEADEEWDALWRTVVADVVPALLGPLQQSQGEGQGQGIEPCLVHGDLWDENTAEEAGTGEAFVFDPASFWAHNEYELGNWRASRHRLSASGAVQAYKDEFPPSKPGRRCLLLGSEFSIGVSSWTVANALAAHSEHQWDDRNRLYSLRFDIGTVIGIPGCGLRAV